MVTGRRRTERGGSSQPARRLAGQAAWWVMVGASLVSGCVRSAPQLREEAPAPSAEGKLAAGLRVPMRGSESERISVLIRTVGPINATQRRALRHAGVEVRAVRGDVVAASLRRDALGHLAALQFVRYIEPAQALHTASEVTP